MVTRVFIMQLLYYATYFMLHMRCIHVYALHTYCIHIYRFYAHFMLHFMRNGAPYFTISLYCKDMVELYYIKGVQRQPFANVLQNRCS